MKLRGLIIVLMLLGVMTLEAKPKYRIETFVINGTRLYQPQQKVWFRTSMGTLPFKVVSLSGCTRRSIDVIESYSYYIPFSIKVNTINRLEAHCSYL